MIKRKVVKKKPVEQDSTKNAEAPKKVTKRKAAVKKKETTEPVEAPKKVETPKKVSKKKTVGRIEPDDKRGRGAPKASEKYKYTVDNLVEDLGISKASVRVKLRRAGIEKADRAYGWTAKTKYLKVLKQLRKMA